MDQLMIFLSVLFFCLSSTVIRFFQLKLRINDWSFRLYQSCYCLVASALNFIFYGVRTAPLTLTVIYAVCFGILFFTASFLNARCLDIGPMSLTSVITNLSLSIPLVFSLIVYGENISLLGGVGLCLLVVTIFLSAFSSSNDGGKRVNLQWLIAVFFAFASNGTTAVLQKVNQTMLEGKSDGAFLGIAYGVGGIIYFGVFIVTLINRKKHPEKQSGHYVKRDVDTKYVLYFIIAVLLTGLGSFMGNGLLNILSVKVDAAILYPCINGGLALMCSLVSMLLFKERVSLRKIITLAIGITAIVCLAI
ncbi:MAG: hypothetical protein IKK58_05975 [Clostridia bacterium]|nr:hypothetical protein [Clostridia bacterium]